MAKYPWCPVWFDDLCNSSNWQRIRWSTQGIFTNCLRYVRREPEFLGIICDSGGKKIDVDDLAHLIDRRHPERVKKHLLVLFDMHFLENDGGLIRVCKFKEKIEAAVNTFSRNGSQDGIQNGKQDEKTPLLGPVSEPNLGPKTGKIPERDPKRSRNVPVLFPKRETNSVPIEQESYVYARARASESESEAEENNKTAAAANSARRAAPPNDTTANEQPTTATEAAVDRLVVLSSRNHAALELAKQGRFKEIPGILSRGGRDGNGEGERTARDEDGKLGPSPPGVPVPPGSGNPGGDEPGDRARVQDAGGLDGDKRAAAQERVEDPPDA